MKNKTIFLILVALIAFVIVVNGIAVGANTKASDSTIAISSSTIYVPDDYSTIQEAVDNVPVGGTIIVREGTYTESVHVNKRLTIKSEKGADKTTVHAFEVTSAYVKIIGFTVKEAFTGVYLIHANYCDILDNVVSGNHHGIYLNSSSHNNITNNIVSGNHHGIYLSSSSNNNTLMNNIASNNDNQGITVEFSSENRIIDNNATNNWIGIMLEDSSSNNILINNVSSNAYGIFMRRSDNNRLTNNTANKSGMDGMYLGYSSSNNITNNICLNNNFKDIRLVCSSYNNLTNNRGNIFLRISSHNNLTNNRAWKGDIGIYLEFFSNYNTLINNTISGTINGIYLNASSNYNNLTNNTALNNKYGILLLSSRNNTLTKNIASKNSYGIYLDSSRNNNLTINNASNNNYGIVLLASSNNNTIIENTVNWNEYHGIHLESLCNNVTENKVSNNPWGIVLYFSNSKENRLSNNTVCNNTRGICIGYSSNNTLIKNTVSDNADFGIYLESANNNTIYNNYFNNTNNSYDNGNNTWNITKTAGTNIVGGPYLGGNYWGDYEGTDLDGDKLGDTLLPYNCGIQNGGDWHPLIIISKIILKASKDGYASVKQEIDNDENFERIEISGNITDKSTGEPIEGAKVEIVKGAEPASTTTDADGTYTITAIIPEGSGSDTREDVNFELTPSEYIVGVYEITSEVIDLIEENNGTIIDQCQYENGPRALLVYISEEKNIGDFINNVQNSPLVKYVELNRVVYACYIPNDPLYPRQWGPKNIRAGGPPNPSAWDVETGDKNVTIAIVDTGIQYNHEDLYRFNDGTVKYVYGYDWVDMDDDPSPEVVQEEHGTHCTGIATAVMDNHKGIAGIAPNCSFIAERTMFMVWNRSGWWGVGFSWNISRGIMDAADHDADIISMSFSNPKPSEFERDATLYASSLGCILVAAAGNDADLPGYAGGIDFPAAYPWVIAVGATNQQNLRAPFSKWGPELELVAPGTLILSTVFPNGYESGAWNGTSMATPHVAGVAALVKSRAERWPEEPLATNPSYHLNNDQIREVLIQSAVDLGPPGGDEEYGYGKVDAGRAVRCINISGKLLEALLNAPIPHPPEAPAPPEVRVTSIEGPTGIYTTNENTTLARITPDGDYFVRVPPGVYSICAMAYGYIPSRGLGGERVELPAFDFMGQLNTEYRELRLVPFPCNVTGTVTDSVTGLPIEDAFVSLDGPPHIYPPHPNVHTETKTDSNGNYHFILEYSVHPPYPTGVAVYNITVSKEGYQTQTQSFTLNWGNVVTNYYKCPLDPNDYNPPIVNFSLLSGPSELPDLTLTGEDILFIPPSSNSTSSSSGQTTQRAISSFSSRFELPPFQPALLSEYTVGNLSDNEKTTENSHGTIRSVRPYKRSIPRGVSETGVNISSLSAPSFIIKNLTYPPTVNPNQTFHVTVNTNYSFDITTYVYAGIWDYDASEYIAETPDNETLSGTGNKPYTFNLSAPASGIMYLSADLYYWDGYSWIWTDYGDFTVNISAEEPDFTITATPPSQTISQGDSASYIVSLTSQNGFNLPVTLNISGLPSGVTGIFNPNPVIPSNSSTLTLNTSKITPTGNYTLTITGDGGEITHQTTVTLNITGKGNIATIFATIHNIGTTDASDVVVQFFDGDPTAGGVQIGSDQTISSVPAGGTESTEVSWDITGEVGSHDIYVRVDPYNTIVESNENNNQASKQFPIPGVTCSDPKVVIDYTQTSVTDDPVGEGYDISNAPANVDLTTAKGFNISATGLDGSYLFDITFPSPVIESFVLYKLPAWTEIPYSIIGPYTIQVQLDLTRGVLDPAFIMASVAIFDTGEGTYPSIFGTHEGILKLNQTITVSRLYTYPCSGTGGHTEYVKIWNDSGWNVTSTWNRYKDDWHNITFNEPFTLFAKRTYRYKIITGSYPQIIHKPEHTTPDGSYINCTSFVDANKKTYNDWIPAIRLE